ncbi:DUF1344 domain-containing protein [Dysosmobacter sp.]|uniref:DUF1344 domain-containing protein n=1 Tax=Dysosmobacter sp. TaxID=2591382 RepID=UPI002A87F51B|nr:DUF1344 domain-containing protein [Dysosmobacter sp.]MDY3281656.1 DUF1344 domain-containing protein [Dysosmobacter sp.]
MRRFGALALAVLLVMILLAGCGGKSGSQTEKEEHVLSGTVEEKKDFMLVVADDNGDEYALTINGDKPEGWDDAAVGDRVDVTYTGELSVVDPFTGEVLSVEKTD